MEALENLKSQFKTIPPKQKMLLLGLVVFIVVGGFLWYIYLPAREQITALEAELSQLNAQIATDRVKARRLEDLKKENLRLQARLSEAKEQIPSEDEITGLLRQVSELGTTAGLDFRLWRPGNRQANSSGLYTEIPVRVEVRGGFHSVAFFFDSISRMKRIVTLSDVAIADPKLDGGMNRISVAFQATTYSAHVEATDEDKKGAKGSKK